MASLLATHQHVTFWRLTERAEALRKGFGRDWLDTFIIAPPISRMRTLSPPWLRFRGTVTTFCSKPMLAVSPSAVAAYIQLQVRTSKNTLAHRDSPRTLRTREHAIKEIVTRKDTPACVHSCPWIRDPAAPKTPALPRSLMRRPRRPSAAARLPARPPAPLAHPQGRALRALRPSSRAAGSGPAACAGPAIAPARHADTVDNLNLTT